MTSSINIYLNPYHNLFYPNGKKVVTREILDKLESLGLAVWYMDDGSFNRKRCSIATYQFTEQIEMIVDWFKDKYDLNIKIQSERKNKNSFLSKKLDRILIYKSLRMDTKNSQKFIDLIKPYITPIECMRYKIQKCLEVQPISTF